VGFRRLARGSTRAGASSVNETVEFVDPETGSVRRCEDPEALPESLRRATAGATGAVADGSGAVVEVSEKILIRDAEGHERVYGSLDELPSDSGPPSHTRRTGRPSRLSPVRALSSLFSRLCQRSPVIRLRQGVSDAKKTKARSNQTELPPSTATTAPVIIRALSEA
jgi:hypothetical protein